MLVQDTLTGYLHEVPDAQLYEPEFAEYPEPMGEVVYDGFGNPVGLPFLAPAAAALAPRVFKALPGIAQRLPGIARGFRGLFGRKRKRRALPAPAAQAFQQVLPGATEQPIPAPGGEADFAEVPYRMPMTMPMTRFRRPPGWIPRPSPYTGLRPRRVYMRCMVWRGPRGLVPAQAAQTPPAAIAPPVTPVVQQARLRGTRRARRIRGRRR
jgi:hypothetical protein